MSSNKGETNFSSDLQLSECFSKLCSDEIMSVFSYLDKNDLLNLRLVSQPLKTISEECLKKRADRLPSLRSFKKLDKVEFLTQFYSHLTSVKIDAWKGTSEQFLKFLSILKRNLLIKHLTIIDGFTDEDYINVGRMLPGLKSLEINVQFSNDITSDGFFKMLKQLSKLKRLTATKREYLEFRNEYRYSIPESLTIFNLYNIDVDELNFLLDLKADVLEKLCYVRLRYTRRNLLKFEDIDFQASGEKIFKCKNLKQLTFLAPSASITNLSSIDCKYLTSLNLAVYEITFEPSCPKLEYVKKLVLELGKSCDTRMARLLSLFPALESLFIQDITFKSVVQTCREISKFHHLKHLALNQIFAMHQNVNHLYDVIKSPPQCTKFSIDFDRRTDDQLKELLDLFEEIARKHSYHQVTVKIYRNESMPTPESKNLKFFTLPCDIMRFQRLTF
ncbi:hypothetical protein B4U79_17443 [Dinothrombium tinctorium]|uniref:F-box domain-containing protein n=1 Tax=Dinothrombium tinctorium TaxID=1965070 RepID=A0A3S3S0D8_9ACAR|nr:hypothetical protein B4U79_17756 [Dinothrombium tinctorium]RWS08629.1 hypothetical protein B4U79_17755 [Dinothrombium tinctorium]RWS12580.1 hypothetical protein B4U79_17443 [Dinothrombium tinctorium]